MPIFLCGREKKEWKKSVIIRNLNEFFQINSYPTLRRAKLGVLMHTFQTKCIHKFS